MSRHTWTIAALVVAALGLAGCAEPIPLSEPGYQSGDGTVAQYPSESRGEPITFDGTTDQGTEMVSSELIGSVVVVNFWYAGCAPCRLEAPWLQQVSVDYADQGVTVVGVNLLDDAATARAFAETFDLTYPSLLDTGGQISLQFAGYASPSAVPTTVVLDQQGRPAARIVGLLDESVLRGLIDDVLEEAQ